MNGKTNVLGESKLTGDAVEGKVLSGATFYSNDPKVKKIGSMPDKTGWESEIKPGDSIIVPAGYHDGSGTVNSSRVTTSFVLIANGSGGAYTPIESVQQCNCPLNRIAWSLYIKKNGDDRAFGHRCRVSVSTDDGVTWVVVYYGDIESNEGATIVLAFNPSLTVYTHVKMELWNATVYNCSGLLFVYYQQ